MAEPATVTGSEAVPKAKLTVEEVLARFDGDAVKALGSAIADIEFLHRELRFASLAMSFGFARGWRPSIERPVEKLDAKAGQCQTGNNV